jgi:hypothetical protein
MELDNKIGGEVMGLGVGIFLIAIGAILAFAVNLDTGGVINLHTIGLILLVVGIIGTILSMVFWSSWGGTSYLPRRRGRREIIEDDL